MVVRRVKKVKEWWLDNTSYKVISLIVAVLLWSALISRSDKPMTHLVPLQVLIRDSQQTVNQLPENVRLSLKGSRLALAKFKKSQPQYALDLTNLSSGRQIVRLSRDGIFPPEGVRVLNVQPSELAVVLRRRDLSPKVSPSGAPENEKGQNE